MQMTNLVATKEVQTLLDRATGMDKAGGNARLKAIMRDFLESTMSLIEKHDISESEFWQAINYLQNGAPEFGLIVPGVGIEHFLDLHMDAQDASAGLAGGTPRTIEGPLYVAGAPLVESGSHLTDDADEGEILTMSGAVRGPDGEAVSNAILHVWHANSKGFYSYFDPTGEQARFNNRRRLKLGADGRDAFSSIMPRGYSVPPGGATDVLMKVLGRHGKRPAHVHFIIEAPGYRRLTTQINFGDDPFARDDFAFGTREGLLPTPDRSRGDAHITFDFVLARARSNADGGLSRRLRVSA
jgi:catechol 1,2-dioxygenase